MKRALIVLVAALGYAGAVALGWQANQRIAILAVDEYADLLAAQLNLRMILSDPSRICGKPSGFM